MNDLYIPPEESVVAKFKPDAMFANYKLKSVPYSYRKGEQYMAWNCNGSAIACAQSKIRIFRFNNSTHSLEVDKNELKGHDSIYVDNLAWHPSNPDLLAYITSKHHAYNLWDVREKNSRKIPSKNQDRAQPDKLNIVFSPDGNTIALCNRDNKLTFYDVRKEEEICEAQFEMDVHEFQWDPSGSVIIIVGSLNGSGTVHVCDGRDLSHPEVDLLERTQAECHRIQLIWNSLKIQCLAVDPKGKYFATGSTDTLIGLWDMNEFAMLKTYSQSDFGIEKLSFNHDGSLLSSISNDKLITIHNTQSDKNMNLHSIGNVLNYLERESSVHSIHWHPHQNILALLSDDKVDTEGNLRLYGPFI